LTAVRFGIDVAQQRIEWDELVARARLGEEVGFDGAWGFDHFQPMYGEGPGNCFEGMTTLAALAGVTSRIRLGLLVTGVTYRHPSVLAAQAVTVDHASDGRLEIATRLMSGERVSYDGTHMSLRDAQLRPVPVQQPHPPIWIGGTGPRRTLPLAARFADAWHAFGSPTSLREPSARLDRLAEDAGRDPSAITRAGSLSLSGSLDDVRRFAEQWRNAGFGYLVCGWPTEGRGRVEEFASRILRDIG
jgi:alkanesulfonate monooxygenase SsuD/methylene tetrahydromethanopterin reductase-like flavin-dependent oxidoreductase (luciferase family)